jgi:predicted nucleic acid-binding protein
MAHTYTVDASVWMNAFNPYEAGHMGRNRLLARLQAQAVLIIVPTLLLPEVAAAVSRGSEDEELALEFVQTLHRLPHLV